MYSKKFRLLDAHDEGIWCCAWSKFDKGNSETICTGSVDDKLKIWNWDRDKLELRHQCIGGQLGITSLDMNKVKQLLIALKKYG